MNIPTKYSQLVRFARRNPRQEVLQAWRGLPAGERAGPFRAAKTPGAVLPSILTSLGLERKQAEAEILRVWNYLIDPNIVAHARPTGLNKGTLFVTVDNSVWLDEIVRYRRREILDRLQHGFGRDLITRISFRVG